MRRPWQDSFCEVPMSDHGEQEDLLLGALGTLTTLLMDRDELLLRQVFPGWIDEEGVLTSQAFRPSKGDEGKLSIARGSLTTAEAAFKHYTTELCLRSAGTWAVTVGEALDAELQSYDEKNEKVPAHGFIDFRELGRGEAERRAKRLLARAKARGRLFPDQ
jgi:hypothetical protein